MTARARPPRRPPPRARRRGPRCSAWADGSLGRRGYRARAHAGGPRPRPRRSSASGFADHGDRAGCERGLLAFHAGDWAMPPKVYLESPPYGDFRAMPARGGGIALLKWVTSFPEPTPPRGLPTVTGVICLSNATTGEPVMLLDARSVTALRTGAVAAVATVARARADARSVGIIGCGLHGAWAARCLAAAGYGPGCLLSTLAMSQRVLAAELGWEAGSRTAALRCDIVAALPRPEIVVDAGDLRPGLHLNMLEPTAPANPRPVWGAVASCALFCDEWEQASHGGELTAAVQAGLVSRESGRARSRARWRRAWTTGPGGGHPVRFDWAWCRIWRSRQRRWQPGARTGSRHSGSRCRAWAGRTRVDVETRLYRTLLRPPAPRQDVGNRNRPYVPVIRPTSPRPRPRCPTGLCRVPRPSWTVGRESAPHVALSRLTWGTPTVGCCRACASGPARAWSAACAAR